VHDAGLLEREAELTAITSAIDGARRGAGGVVLVEGVAGIGKTALLAEAQAQARTRGMSLLAATGGELERDFPYGVVRQLFEPATRRLPPSERTDVLAGAAAPAAGIVAGGAAAGDPLSIQHALYWLTVNLAARAPLLLTVDDLQWADAASLRVLLFLVRRLDGLSALLVLATRSEDAGGPLFTRLAAQPLTRG
jgi:predicted ATPase